jgi:hypothetical protein
MAFVDEGILDLFGESSILLVQTTESDHYALLIQLNRMER